MPKTNFVPQTPVTSAFLNAINNPVFVANPTNDGEIPLIRDADLDASAGSLLSRSNQFLNAFATVGSSTGLFATVGAGTVILGDGTPVDIATTQVSLPANSVRQIWIDPFGVLKNGPANPNDGSIMIARVTTDAAKVTQTRDLRPRFKIGTVDYNAPAVVGQSVFFEFPVTGREFTDEMGWKWLNPVGGVKISKSGAGGDVANDGYERLYKRLWTIAGLQVYNNGSSTPIAKGTSADADWTAGKHILVRDPGGRSSVGAGTNGSTTYAVGQEGGAARVTLSEAEMPSHNHTATSSPHTHNYDKTQEGQPPSGGNRMYQEGNTEGYQIVENTTSATVSVSIGNKGGGQSHENMPPFSVGQKMIFTGIKA